GTPSTIYRYRNLMTIAQYTLEHAAFIDNVAIANENILRTVKQRARVHERGDHIGRAILLVHEAPQRIYCGVDAFRRMAKHDRNIVNAVVPKNLKLPIEQRT